MWKNLILVLVGMMLFTVQCPAKALTTQLNAMQTYKVGDVGPAGGIIFYDRGSYTTGLTPNWRYMEAAPYDSAFAIPVQNPTPPPHFLPCPFPASCQTDTMVQWCNGCSETVTNNVVNSVGYAWTNTADTAVGTGKSNTKIIIDVQGLTGNYAALLCKNLSIVKGGVTYNDFFLPSEDELNLILYNVFWKAVGFGGFPPIYFQYGYDVGLVSHFNYWSSSEKQYNDMGGHGDELAISQNFYSAGQGQENKADRNFVRCARQF